MHTPFRYLSSLPLQPEDNIKIVFRTNQREYEAHMRKRASNMENEHIVRNSIDIYHKTLKTLLKNKIKTKKVIMMNVPQVYILNHLKLLTKRKDAYLSAKSTNIYVYIYLTNISSSSYCFNGQTAKPLE